MPADVVRVVHSALTTPAGKKLLEHLEEQYQKRRLFNDSPGKMAYLVGQHDLVEDLKQLLKDARNE